MVRRRNRETEKWVAQKTAPIIGIYDDKMDDKLTKMLRLIEYKGGDFYRPSLNPNPGSQVAWDHIAYGGVKSALQKELQKEARLYYGLDAPAPMVSLPVAVAPAAELKTPKAIMDAEKAKEYKQEFVEKINPVLTEEVQSNLNDLYVKAATAEDISTLPIDPMTSSAKRDLLGLAAIGGGGTFTTLAALGYLADQDKKKKEEEELALQFNHVL